MSIELKIAIDCFVFCFSLSGMISCLMYNGNFWKFLSVCTTSLWLYFLIMNISKLSFKCVY